jgi:hypothetical protein
VQILGAEKALFRFENKDFIFKIYLETILELKEMSTF